MNKNKKSKNIILVIILLAIVGIAVGYAALSQTLQLNGTATVAGANDWNVHFKSATNGTTNGGVSDQAIELSTDTLSGTFSATLEPGASASFNVSVVNDGSIAAALDAVRINTTTLSGSTTSVTDENNYVTCTVTPVTQSGTLAKDSGQHDYIVTLECADLATLPETATNSSFTVYFDYVQAAQN